ARFKTKPAEHWLDALEEAGIPCGPVNDMLQALSDPQTIAREMVVEVEHSTLGSVKTIGLPIKFSQTPGKVRSGAPLYGEHTKAGPGGGTDNFARAVQNIITKYKLVEQPIVVVNKAGGSGAEGYTYTKAMAGDPYKIVFGTSNAWTQPMVSKVAYNYTDLTPIAAMIQDEFLLWLKQDAPYQNVQDFLKAVAAKPPGDFKMGGAQSKDTDETLTRMIDKTAKVKFTYIPFKSGAEAAVQLAGGHI